MLLQLAVQMRANFCTPLHSHPAVLQVYYKPEECTYESLLDCFFEHVDPTTKNRQGMDMGSQYRSGIYYHTDQQKQAAEKVHTHRFCCDAVTR